MLSGGEAAAVGVSSEEVEKAEEVGRGLLSGNLWRCLLLVSLVRQWEVMPGSPENIPLGECALSQSQDRLTPPSHAASTVFSLSRSESLWTPEPPPKRCDVFWFPIHFMSTGGSFLACGAIISGLCFAGQCQPAPALLGPALLSIGLMVLVVGVVLIPITKKNRKRSHMRRPLGYYKPPVVDV